MGRRNSKEKVRAHVVPFARKKRCESISSFDDGCRLKVGFGCRFEPFETGRLAWTSVKIKVLDPDDGEQKSIAEA